MFRLTSRPQTELEKYFDNMGYWEKRELITNALHNREIQSPFTKKEIITFARKEAKESVFNASYSALQGFDNDVLLIGKPSINPETNEKNSLESQKGIIGKVGDNMQNYLIKLVIVISCLLWVALKVKKAF